jgi:hypothetical protein
MSPIHTRRSPRIVATLRASASTINGVGFLFDAFQIDFAPSFDAREIASYT